MKKSQTYLMRYLPATLFAVLLSACGTSSSEKAEELLNEARTAVSEARFDDARHMIDSLRSTYPKEVEVRRKALAFSDSLELAESENLLQQADSIETFRKFELEDCKRAFVFEKQEKYQSQGYFVLPKHAGNKTNLSFFPEVEESGKLLFVTIDSKRHYAFHEVPMNTNGYRDYSAVELTKEQTIDANHCYELAYYFLQYNHSKEVKEELERKVKFYKLKIENKRYLEQ